MTNEDGDILNHIVNRGIATVNRATAHRILLETGGNTLSRGRVVKFKANYIGAGVYRLTVVDENGGIER